MSPEEAIFLVNELIAAEVQLMKEENSRRNGSTKKATLRERKAAAALFSALTSGDPTAEEIERMVVL